MEVSARIEEATSAIAAAIGEPARSRMLFALLDDRARTSTELALVAEVSPSTASVHLARLNQARLVCLHVQGRHRYYRLASRHVADLLERLTVLAGSPGEERADAFRASTPAHLVGARTCYDHIAGTLGVSLHDALIARGWLARQARRHNAYSLTDAGARQLASLGIAVDALRAARRRFAFGCLDWSERRPHLGGAMAAALLSMMLTNRWLKRGRHSRALTVTAIGVRELQKCLALRVQ
jgi:DNA-binding transcriptional ArsR family regulator